MGTKIFAKNFRGFKNIEVDLKGTNFLVGDNSSGKSSILHLIDAILRDELSSTPRLNEDLGVSAHDYFSPLFPNEDVIFGFTAEESDDKLTKIISVRKQKGAAPKVVRTSYIFNGTFISIRDGNDGPERKRIEPVTSEADLVELHCSNDLYSKVEKKVPKNVEIAATASLLFLFSLNELSNNNEDERRRIASWIFKTSLPNCSFVGPIRSLPAKYYEQMRRVSPVGLHFASMWSNISRRSATTYFAQVNQFGQESGLFDQVKVEPISTSIEEPPLLVHVTRNGHDYLLNQVGVGVSQVAPVLTEAIFAAASKGGRLALFQQPELHLHPIAQAALGSFFCKLSSGGFTAFLETHSNFLIDRFRSDLNKQKKKSVDARILFCTSGSEGNSVIVCEIQRNGKMVGVPDSYYEFFLDEAARTMI